MSSYTEHEFAAKVEHEGGILDALDYGLQPGDAPEGEWREAWAELYKAWVAIQEPMKRVQILLEDVDEPECDDFTDGDD